jgi:hypothetical protein
MKAIQFLAREVPAWSRENGCYSCHNNGDGARALYAAAQAGYRLPSEALADTTAWVKQPERWEHNKGDPGFSDQILADIQFAASLLAANDARRVRDESAMRSAATKLIANQAADGSWPVEPQNPVGSPTTFGTALATFMAWQTVARSSEPQARRATAAAERWLRSVKPVTVPNAAVVLLVAERKEIVALSVVREALAYLKSAQAPDGGWGPYKDSPSEAFDTALAMLALAHCRDDVAAAGAVARGSAFLQAQQLADGSWPATTRPSGGDSYAQKVSTTAWATLALLRAAETGSAARD